ncbi:MAG: HAD family hydrolase [Desulfobacteraceae bacterium]|nr:MAG: HAD family hydrolase [Desulfobacteraceae bacterium]
MEEYTSSTFLSRELKQPAVFIDRDGTINEQMGYINHLSRFHLLPRAAAAIKLLNDKRIPVIVVTNQSGVARGYFPYSLVDEIHQEMAERLARQGAHIDAIYVCPHHPEAKSKELRQTCTCRKPRPGLFDRAATDLNLELDRSYVIGDRWSDMEAAANCGAKGILVLTGYGKGDLAYVTPPPAAKPALVADDLYAAAEWLLQDLCGS